MIGGDTLVIGVFRGVVGDYYYSPIGVWPTGGDMVILPLRGVVGVEWVLYNYIP